MVGLWSKERERVCTYHQGNTASEGGREGGASWSHSTSRFLLGDGVGKGGSGRVYE